MRLMRLIREKRGQATFLQVIRRSGVLPYAPKKVACPLFFNTVYLSIFHYAPKNILRSFSTSVIPAMPNFSTRTFTTLGDKNAGKVGPKWIFFTPR